MLVIYILAAAYVGVAVFAVIMTCLEILEKRLEPRVYPAIGVLLCLVWPVLIVATLATQTYMRLNGRRMSHSNG